MPPFIWKQIERLIQLGFHEAAGFTKNEFQKYVPPPKRDNGLLVVSEKCLNIAVQCQLLGIQNHLFLDYHQNIVAVPDTLLYWRYAVDDGRTTKGLLPAVILEQLKNRKRLPATTVEVLAIYRENPDVIRDSHFIDVLGSQISKGGDIPGVPVLLLNGRLVNAKEKTPELSIYYKVGPDEKGYEKWGAASVARE